MQKKSDFNVHLVFDAPMLTSLSDTELHNFFSEQFWPLVMNHAHDVARKVTGFAVSQGEDRAGFDLYFKSSAHRLIYAHEHFKFKKIGAGRLDFSFSFENNRPAFGEFSNCLRRPALRYAIYDEVLRTVTMALVTNIQWHDSELVKNLINEFWIGYSETMDIDADLFIENESADSCNIVKNTKIVH